MDCAQWFNGVERGEDTAGADAIVNTATAETQEQQDK